MVKGVAGRGVASRSGLTDPYQLRACDGCSDLVGLDLITVLYHGAILALPRPRGHFTNTPPPPEDITHSGLDYVLCGVIMD